MGAQHRLCVSRQCAASHCWDVNVTVGAALHDPPWPSGSEGDVLGPATLSPCLAESLGPGVE